MVLTSYLDKSYFVASLGWIYRKYSNDVARQVETPSKGTIFVARDKFILSRDITYISHWWLRYSMTAKK